MAFFAIIKPPYLSNLLSVVCSFCLHCKVSSTYSTVALVHHIVSKPFDSWVGGCGWVAGVHPSTGHSWWPASIVFEDICIKSIAVVVYLHLVEEQNCANFWKSPFSYSWWFTIEFLPLSWHRIK